MFGLSQSQKAFALIGVAAMSLLLSRHIHSSNLLQGNSHETEGEFCKGMFMVMSMSGFQWSLVGREPGDCLSYFAPDWKLDSRGKFQGAMVYTFLLGILTEGSHALQVLLRPYVPRRLAHVTDSLLLGLQRFMAYIIMLIAMMYSWEMLISILAGVVVGRLIFPNITRREWRKEARRTGSGDMSSHPTLASTLDDDDSNRLQAEVEPLLAGDISMRRRR